MCMLTKFRRFAMDSLARTTTYFLAIQRLPTQTRKVPYSRYSMEEWRDVVSAGIVGSPCP